MALLRNRRDRIDRIAIRVTRLRDRAADLLAREQALRGTLEGATDHPRRRLGAARTTRWANRARGRLDRLAEERAEFVQEELRSIMVALEEQSRRTRERLDQELGRLAPVQEEWERLRSIFDALESAVGTPAFEPLAGHLDGTLRIPEFPVREREGYCKPFPQGAVVF